MKRNIKVCLGYLLVWLCSGITFYSFKNGDTMYGMVAALISWIYFVLVE